MERPLLVLTGVVCPMTWMQTSLRLAGMSPGESLEVVVDDGKPAAEFPRSAKADGHRVRSANRQDGSVRFVVERGGLFAPVRTGPGLPAAPGGRDRAPRDESGRSAPGLRRYESVAELIADPDNPTPLVRLGRIAPTILLKLEWMNPFGSIKDRTARYLLEGLQARGMLGAGRQLVEPSSGNTGIALVALANLLGIPTTVTIPDAVPQEKRTLLRLLGATVWPTPDDLCPVDHPKDGAIALAASIAAGEGYVMPNQYENQDNVRAHYETTGPEIWRQTEGRVAAFVAGYGTCGTLTGVGRYLKERNPKIRVIAVEPRPGHRLPGLKNLSESKRPGILDDSVIDQTLTLDDESSYRMAIRLAREESLLVGPSTGAIVEGATRLAGQVDGPVVAISPDSALKYLTFYEELVRADGRPPLQPTR